MICAKCQTEVPLRYCPTCGQDCEPRTQIQTFGRNRLSPGVYTFDLKAVRGAPMTMNGQPSTFIDVYSKLRDSKITKVERIVTDTYHTDTGEVRLDGEVEEWPLRATLGEFVELFQQGIDPQEATWFYYAADISRDADVSHTFFAVHRGKIVIESCHFSSEEPVILKPRPKEDEPIWRDHPHFDQAFETYWYRKFYTETVTGQLMVLRADKPILYHYQRPQARNIEWELQFLMSVKTYRLIWIAMPLLVAMVFPWLKIYMAIAAAVLAGSFLWLCWDTRNAGKP